MLFSRSCWWVISLKNFIFFYGRAAHHCLSYPKVQRLGIWLGRIFSYRSNFLSSSSTVPTIDVVALLIIKELKKWRPPFTNIPVHEKLWCNNALHEKRKMKNSGSMQLSGGPWFFFLYLLNQQGNQITEEHETMNDPRRLPELTPILYSSDADLLLLQL